MGKLARYSIFLVAIIMLTACHEQDAELARLDNLIDRRASIQAARQERINELAGERVNELAGERVNELAGESVQCTVYGVQSERMNELFAAYGELYDAYRAFDIDSQLYYAQERLRIAQQLRNDEYIQAANMNIAEVYIRSGSFYDATNYLNRLSAGDIMPSLIPYYYHLKRTLYGLQADFAMTEPARDYYRQQTQWYRDSILIVQDSTSLLYAVVRADGLAAQANYADALLVLNDYEQDHPIAPEEQGIYAITKAQIYRSMGDTAAQRQQLIIAACADISGAVREYIALRELAIMLYDEGDIDRAYRYMQCAIEDARAGNIRSRAMELSTIYPIIESAYQRKESARLQLMRLLMGSIVVICVLLIVFLLYYGRQRRLLQQLNQQLTTTNDELLWSNSIKTVYVGHYMEMTSQLIDRFDTWRKQLNQLVKSGEVKVVQTEIASQRFTTEQLNTFYRDFDEAFLDLFPNFVQDVQALMIDGTEFRTKPGERLNTDLRVLSCIRLGITDSAQIASFLRLSLSTIYNSRTRMRNMAKGNRDTFEEKITTL